MQIDNVLGYSPRTYLAHHGGVYAIRNLINDRVYIGQTTRFLDRMATHNVFLRNNKHSIPQMQLDWNTHGDDNFKFEVLIGFRQELFCRGYIEREEMTSLEVQFWKQHKHNCYNLRKPYLSSWVAREPYRPWLRAS